MSPAMSLKQSFLARSAIASPTVAAAQTHLAICEFSNILEYKLAERNHFGKASDFATRCT